MRKTLLLALMVLVSLGPALLVLEWLYRLQLVDTYRPELHTFNPAQVLAPNAKPTLLVMGDSFTASRTSYAGILQDTLQEWRILMLLSVVPVYSRHCTWLPSALLNFTRPSFCIRYTSEMTCLIYAIQRTGAPSPWYEMCIGSSPTTSISSAT